jgi:hypothetical protein
MDLTDMSLGDLKTLRKEINGKIKKTPKRVTISSLMDELNFYHDVRNMIGRVTQAKSVGKEIGNGTSNIRYTLLALLERVKAQQSMKYERMFTSRDGQTSRWLQVVYCGWSSNRHNEHFVLLSNGMFLHGGGAAYLQTPGEWVLQTWEDGEQLLADVPTTITADFLAALEQLPTKPTQRVLDAMMSQQTGADNPQHALNKAVIDASGALLQDMAEAAAYTMLIGTDPPVYPSLGEWTDVCIEKAARKHTRARFGSYRGNETPWGDYRNGTLSFPFLHRLLSTTNLIAADFGTGVPYRGIFLTNMGDILRVGRVEQRLINDRASVLEEAVAMKLGFKSCPLGWIKAEPRMWTNPIGVGHRYLSVTGTHDPNRSNSVEALNTNTLHTLKRWGPNVCVTFDAACYVNGQYRCVVDATSIPLPRGDQTARRMIMFASTYRDSINTLANDKEMLQDLFEDVPYETIRECREIVMQATGGPKAAPLDSIQLN